MAYQNKPGYTYDLDPQFDDMDDSPALSGETAIVSTKDVRAMRRSIDKGAEGKRMDRVNDPGRQTTVRVGYSIGVKNQRRSRHG
jgi:hypothetical protein